MAEEDGHTSKSFWAPLAVEYGGYVPLQAGSIDGTDTVPHDRGIVRAMNSRCETAVSHKPNKQVKGNPESTLFVARLSHSTTENQLREVFSKYGKVEHCRIVRDIVTGRSKGYAFVSYKHTQDAEEAYHRCFKMYLDGTQIFVDLECERTLPGWVPRRLGGGFGGKKESGQLRFGGRDRPFKKPIILGSQRLGSSGGRRGDWDHNHRRREEQSREFGRDSESRTFRSRDYSSSRS